MLAALPDALSPTHICARLKLAGDKCYRLRVGVNGSASDDGVGSTKRSASELLVGAFVLGAAVAGGPIGAGGAGSAGRGTYVGTGA